MLKTPYHHTRLAPLHLWIGKSSGWLVGGQRGCDLPPTNISGPRGLTPTLKIPWRQMLTVTTNMLISSRRFGGIKGTSRTQQWFKTNHPPRDTVCFFIFILGQGSLNFPPIFQVTLCSVGVSSHVCFDLHFQRMINTLWKYVLETCLYLESLAFTLGSTN